MTVEELIKKLERLNPDAEVIIPSPNFEHKGETVPVTFIHNYNDGSVKNKKFIDAFDGIRYTKQTWSIFGGHNPVVLLN